MGSYTGDDLVALHPPASGLVFFFFPFHMELTTRMGKS